MLFPERQVLQHLQEIGSFLTWRQVYGHGLRQNSKL